MHSYTNNISRLVTQMLAASSPEFTVLLPNLNFAPPVVSSYHMRSTWPHAVFIPRSIPPPIKVPGTMSFSLWDFSPISNVEIHIRKTSSTGTLASNNYSIIYYC
jgi:hypothetical protein